MNMLTYNFPIMNKSPEKTKASMWFSDFTSFWVVQLLHHTKTFNKLFVYLSNTSSGIICRAYFFGIFWVSVFF